MFVSIFSFLPNLCETDVIFDQTRALLKMDFDAFSTLRISLPLFIFHLCLFREVRVQAEMQNSVVFSIEGRKCLPEQLYIWVFWL